MQKMWKGINELISGRARKINLVNILNIDNILNLDPKLFVRLFKNPLAHSMFLNPVTPAEIITFIKNFVTL